MEGWIIFGSEFLLLRPFVVFFLLFRTILSLIFYKLQPIWPQSSHEFAMLLEFKPIFKLNSLKSKIITGEVRLFHERMDSIKDSDNFLKISINLDTSVFELQHVRMETFRKVVQSLNFLLIQFHDFDECGVDLFISFQSMNWVWVFGLVAH